MLSSKHDKSQNMSVLTPAELRSLLDDTNYNPSYTRVLKSRYPTTYSHIQGLYDKEFKENVYLYLNNVPAGSIVCKHCGGTGVRFVNIVDGYKTFCSAECSYKYRDKHSLKNTLLSTQANKDRPICKNERCNEEVMLRADGTWSEYCSFECRGQGNSLISREKSKNTMLHNHGVKHALQSSDIKDKMRASSIAKWGVEHPMQNKEITARIHQTMLKKYGVVSTWQTTGKYQECVDKVSAKYGYSPGAFTNVSQIPEIHRKKLNSSYLTKPYMLPSGKEIRIQGYENKFLDIALQNIDENGITYSPAPIAYEYHNDVHFYYPDFAIDQVQVEVKSDYTFYAEYDKNIAKLHGVINSGQTLVYSIFVNNIRNYIYKNDENVRIKEHLDSLRMQYNEMHQIGDYFVDYYIDSKKIAIVYRSLIFTSEQYIEHNDHYSDMHKYFEGIGIQLIAIDEFSVSDKLLNTITSKFVKPHKTIYARECEIQEVKKGAFKFLKDNHIQGHAASTFKYGLYHNNELVALMAFNKFRHGIGKNRGDNAYELVRYATSANVIGGASRLLKHFIKIHNPDLIYSYSENSISTGNLYKVLNFTLEKELKSDYRYIDNKTSKLHHRFSFRKSALKDKLEYYDERLSERELMKINGYVRYYDSGKKTWTLKIR